jgi:predicted transcriptional regulator
VLFRSEIAVEAIKTMARELQDTDFAVRTREYIEYRKAGSSISLIYERMREGELPELDIGSGKAVSGGTSAMMASSGIAEEAQLGIVFTMYEQAYQRYLLAQEMGRQP